MPVKSQLFLSRLVSIERYPPRERTLQPGPVRPDMRPKSLDRLVNDGLGAAKSSLDPLVDILRLILPALAKDATVIGFHVRHDPIGAMLLGAAASSEHTRLSP